ncbi:hypothetical protein NHF50_00305 [Flavobacterium sp. NRK F10]|uniref:hypothetical protein n=1 Tax=Flavobacterium sp. NRK F10 TaxID=2954931 RepID=UPI002090C6F2|nr:hypothetical protein [Flavobacterium sp. NRK F10]MCO6173477.1 hypothetical protein [Flavobacterium sp. NRK F10]
MKSAPHSHTHCQVATADPQAITWQRVCLSKPTTDRQTDEEKEALGGNSRFAKAGVSCFYDSEVQNLSFVHLMKFSAEKPRLRKAAKRYEA